MSLSDAILLEPYRDSRSIWVSIRADQQRGSGRVDDPFHAGVLETSPISATLSLVVGTDPREIIATTSAPHGYIEGDIVVLSGTRDNTGAAAPSYNGPYQIRVAGLPSSQFKCYLDFPATASLTGTAVSVKRIFLLDQLFRSLTQPNLAIHLGPGVFETRGNTLVNLGSQGWEVRPGWKIRGSGIDVTTMKLADARGAPDSQLYSVIGAQTWYLPAHYAEASDLTLDCNAHGNQKTSVGAIFLTGSHTRVRRVRAINWGPQAPPESFVIAVGGSHPVLPEIIEIVDCVIEDCIADQPGLNNNWTTTILGIIGTTSLPEEKPAFFRGGAIRRNVVDATYSRNEVLIEGITKTGLDPNARADVTTKTPHGRKAGDWVVIAGALADGTLNNPYNGSYEIASSPVPAATTFSYFLKKGAGQTWPNGSPVGEMFVDRFPSHYLAAGANSIVKVNPGDPNDHQYLLTTPTPHNRIPGNNVVINGVYVAVAEYANAFNDSHLIDQVLSPTELTFTVHPTALKPIGTINWDPNNTQVQIGVSMQVGVGGGVCHVLEHNRVIGATFAAYGDTYSTKSLHIRNNHFHRVGSRGVYRLCTNYLTPPTGPIPGSSLTYNYEGGKHIATYTSLEPHGLLPGSQVTIGGAFVSYYEDVPAWPYTPYTNVYNGTFTVLAVPAPNQFQYELAAAPPGYGSSENVPTNAGRSPVFSAGASLVAVQATSLTRDPNNKKIAKFTSATPHGFKVGDVVSVFGAQMISSQTPSSFSPAYHNPYNGAFAILAVEPGANPTWFIYEMTSEALDNVRTDGSEGIAPPQCARQVGTALTRNGTVATFRTVRPHFLLVGQIVKVEGALVGGTLGNPFNGTNFALTSAGSSSFTYDMTGVPSSHAYGPVSYAGKDYEGVVQIENNVIDLLPQAVPLPSIGVVTSGGKDFRPNYIFRQVAIRSNLIRYPDNMPDFSQWSAAMACYNCDSLMIENNLIGLERTFPIWFDYSGMVSCVNNLTPQGTLIKASNRDPLQALALPAARLVESYFPSAEDAFLLAF